MVVVVVVVVIVFDTHFSFSAETQAEHCQAQHCSICMVPSLSQIDSGNKWANN